MTKHQLFFNEKAAKKKRELGYYKELSRAIVQNDSKGFYLTLKLIEEKLYDPWLGSRYKILEFLNSAHQHCRGQHLLYQAELLKRNNMVAALIEKGAQYSSTSYFEENKLKAAEVKLSHSEHLKEEKGVPNLFLDEDPEKKQPTENYFYQESQVICGSPLPLRTNSFFKQLIEESTRLDPDLRPTAWECKNRLKPFGV